MSAPAAPTNVQALSGCNQRAFVSWTSSAGATSYTVTSSPGGFTATTSSTNAYVNGLTNGTAYTFTVTATNAGGTSSPSSASNSVTPAASFSATNAASMIGRTLIIVGDFTSSSVNSRDQRIIDFNNNTTSTFIYLNTRNGYAGAGFENVRLGTKYGGGSETAVFATTPLSVPNRYVFAIYFASSSSMTIRGYLYSGGVLIEQPYNANTLAINTSTLSTCSMLWIGRSIFGDPYLNATIVQVALYDGDIPSPLTTLLPLAANTITNTYTANTYSFVATSGFYTVNVSEATAGSGTYTNTSTSVYLDGTSGSNGAYLTLTSFADNGGAPAPAPVATNYISRITKVVVAPVPQGAMQPLTGQTRFMGFGGGFGRQRTAAPTGGGGSGGSGASNPIYYVDPMNASSYSGSGSSITNLGSASVTSQLVNYSYNSANLGIELNAAVETGYLQLSSVANVRTVVMWYKYNSSQLAFNYIIDARTGLSTGYIYSNATNSTQDVGSDWQNISYFNDSGGNISSFAMSNNANWTKFYSLPNQWLMAVITTASAFTDNIRFFNRYDISGGGEGTRVIFGPIKIYDRVLTATEVKADFNQFATRYGYAILP